MSKRKSVFDMRLPDLTGIDSALEKAAKAKGRAVFAVKLPNLPVWQPSKKPRRTKKPEGEGGLK